MSIGVAIVVEEDGRTTEVANVEGDPLETARSIAKRIDNRDDGKKSYEDKGYYSLFPPHLSRPSRAPNVGLVKIYLQRFDSRRGGVPLRW
jgi:hypothetical protein